MAGDKRQCFHVERFNAKGNAKDGRELWERRGPRESIVVQSGQSQVKVEEARADMSEDEMEMRESHD